MSDLDQKIATVERLLDDFRWARSSPNTAEHATYRTLKDIARDLKARLPNSAAEARHEIGARIAKLVRTKTPEDDGQPYDVPQLIGLASLVIARWPVIEHALETTEIVNQEARS